MNTLHSRPPVDTWAPSPQLALPIAGQAEQLLTPRWPQRAPWFLGALLLHAAFLLIISLSPATPAQVPQTLSVSLLPMAPAAVTPPAKPAQTQPVVKAASKPQTRPTPTRSDSGISQAQSAPAQTADASNQQPASGSDKPGNDVPIVAAHDAAYLNNPRPAYPPMSRRLGEQGRVLLEVHVLADGTPSKVVLNKSSGFPRLDEAGLEAVKRWKFVPAKRGNEAIAQVVIIPMPFVLEK